MNERLRVLLIEDSESDSLLLLRELRKAGFEPIMYRVETPAALSEALSREWDIVISDYSLPEFTGIDALRRVRSLELDLPFIIVSGTVGEDVAVEAMRMGAQDYLMKGHLLRLGETIRRELVASRNRAQQKASERSLKHLDRVLHAVRSIDQLIVREKDAGQLVANCCEILVAGSGYDAVSIVVNDSSGVLGLIAAEQGFGKAFEGYKALFESGRLPTCCEKASRTETTDFIGNACCECPTDCQMMNWGENCSRTAIISPLRCQDKTYGYISVVVPEGLESAPDETTLLQELASDIAFSLRNIELEINQEKSEGTLRAIFESASDGILLADFETREIVTANVAMCEMLGIRSGGIKARSLNEFHSEEDLSRIFEYSERKATGTRSAVSGVRTQRFEGGGFTADVNSAVVVLEGKPHLLCIYRDMTMQERAEQALKASETKYREIYDEAPLAYFTVNASDGTIKDCNQAARRLLGMSVEEIQGMNVLSLYADTALGKPAAKEIFKKFLRGEGVTDAELQMKASDGRILDVSLSVFPKLDDSGIVIESRSIVVDITERKSLQTQIAQADRLASMGMLAAGVAHEINNPLSYVLFNIESLVADFEHHSLSLRDAWTRLADRFGVNDMRQLFSGLENVFDPALLNEMSASLLSAREGANRVKRVAKGLSSFSRVEEDLIVPVDLRQVAEIATSMVSNEIKYRARLVKQYEQAPSVMASDGRLSQVLLNLLLNSAHAIPEGDEANQEIRVRVWGEGNEACIEVRDTGRGIPEEQMPYIFEPFFSTKQIGSGTGLGLTISKRIIESYRGRIEINSKVGEGTSFLIRLPAGGSRVQPTRMKDLGMEDQPTFLARILVVDDEAAVRSILTRILNTYRVFEAVSGSKAKEILEQDQSFAVVLCDLMMPDLSGAELHDWVSRSYPDLARRFIFITGGAFTPKSREYLAKVSNTCVEKPFDMAQLKRIVAEVAQGEAGSHPVG